MDQLTVATHDQKLRLWISRIQECRSSGITVEAWCKQQGFSSKNYYYWMRKIKREAFEALPAAVPICANQSTDWQPLSSRILNGILFPTACFCSAVIGATESRRCIGKAMDLFFSIKDWKTEGSNGQERRKMYERFLYRNTGGCSRVYPSTSPKQSKKWIQKM